MRLKQLLKTIFLNPYFFYLVFSIFYFLVIFAHLKPNEYLLIHDHFVWINDFHSENEITVRTKDNFSYNTGISLNISYAYNLLHKTLFLMGFTLHQVELFTFTLLIFTALVCAHFGFKSISKYFRLETSELLISLVTFLYVFGPFGTMSINTGNFWAISFALSYGLMPYLMYLNLRLLHTPKPTFKFLLLYSLVLVAILTYVPFSIPAIFSSLSFWIYRFFKYGFLRFIRDSFFAGLAFLILYIDTAFSYVIDVFTNYVPSNSYGLKDATFPLLRGGYVTLIENLYSWALYTSWVPKNISSYGDYYQSYIFLALSYGMLIFIVGVLARKSKELLDSDLFHIFFALIVNAFFFKGAQKPFGEIYRWLVENIPLFISVRSPDSKFSSMYTVCLVILLLVFSKYLPKKIIIPSYLILLLVMSLPAFNGTAILGGKHEFYKYSFSNDDMEVINYLRGQDKNTAVLTIPSYNLIEKVRPDKEVVVGKDTIALSLAQPFIYLNNRYAIPPQVNDDIGKLYEENDTSVLSKYPIGYLLFRKNVYGNDITSQKEKFLYSLEKVIRVDTVIDNGTYTLYKLPYTPTSFAEKINNSLYYYSNKDGEKELNITIPQNFSKYWVGLSKDTNLPQLLPTRINSSVFPTVVTVDPKGATNIYLLYYPDTIYKFLFYISRVIDIVLISYLYLKRKEIFVNNG